MTDDQELLDRAASLLSLCRDAGLTVATVESCTGGLVAGYLTGIAGSSDVMDRGFVTYTNRAKHELVGVAESLFGSVGAVSKEVAQEMAIGGLRASEADITVGITGVAGPGQSENKPAGLVHIAAARRAGKVIHEQHRFAGDRAAVRRASVLTALDLMIRLVEETG